MTIEKRFWAKVDKRDTGDCWNWIGRDLIAGYGRMGISGHRRGRRMLAHRLSWLFSFGTLPAGLNVCHRCDNPRCINPGHLFLGTQKENMEDCSRKGRVSRKPGRIGEGVYGAKLTAVQVLEIRALCAEGAKQRDIARRFGVAEARISEIKHGHSWKHV